MRLGFSQPQASDYQYLPIPKSSQMMTWVFNRISWYPGDDSGPLETGLASTGWRVNTAGYADVTLLVPVLVGPGTNGSGQVTSPLNPAGAAVPTTMTLDDVAAGVWDGLYTTMFNNLATYLPNCVLRIGNEWFGSAWYPWNGPALGLKGQAAYRHLVDLARSIHTGWRYEWLGCLDLSKAAGYSFQNVQDFYPGDTYVDYLSADLYDTAAEGKSGQAMWDYREAQVAPCLEFAKAHGKPYCITELGLQNVAQTGIGNDDDYKFIQAAYRWVHKNRADLGWVTFFNPLVWDGRLQNNPQTEAVYKALFGPLARQLEGATTHRFISPGFGPIGAIGATGAFVRATGAGLKTIDVTPQAVGNVLVLTILNLGNSNAVTGVSGGGVGTWTRLVKSNPGSPNGDVELWYGAVTTAGAATVTVSSATVGTTHMGCQEFTIGTPATWAPDTTGSSSGIGAASGNYPSLTPAGRNELYVGAAILLGGATGGAQSGFTYLNGGIGFEPNAQFVYNPVASNPTAQAPPWTQSSGNWLIAAGLLVGTPVTPGGGSHRLRLTH